MLLLSTPLPPSVSRRGDNVTLQTLSQQHVRVALLTDVRRKRGPESCCFRCFPNECTRCAVNRLWRQQSSVLSQVNVAWRCWHVERPSLNCVDASSPFFGSKQSAVLSAYTSWLCSHIEVNLIRCCCWRVSGYLCIAGCPCTGFIRDLKCDRFCLPVLKFEQCFVWFGVIKSLACPFVLCSAVALHSMVW